jgi:hypothetical protein
MKKLTPLIASLAAAASLNAGIVILDDAQSFIISEDGLLKLVSDATLTNADEYVLPGQLFVTSDATLTINSGVVMRGIPGAESPFSSGSGYYGGSLIVSRDGQIQAGGTKGAPIIFTTAALDNGSGLPDTTVDYSDSSTAFSGKTTADFWDTASTTAATGTSDAMPPLELTDDGFDMTSDISGDAATATSAYQKMWGGVVILGNAPTSIGLISGSQIVANQSSSKALLSVTNEPYEGQIEGLVSVDIGELSAYGGRNPNDSSGTFKFVSIRHGGEEIGTANEINGLTLGGVGAGTLLEYVEIYSNNDDGFEFFGGTVNTRYLAVTTVADDSFDIDEGFTGLGQFWFSFQADDQYNGDQSGEHDGTDANFSSVDMAFAGAGTSSSGDDNGGGLTLTFPTIYNATYVGGGLYGNRVQDSESNQLFTLRDSFGGAYFNSIFSDARDGAMAVSNDGDMRFDLGDVIFRSNVWYGNNAAFASQADFQATEAGRDGADDNAFKIYNQTGSAFANNVFTSDPWAASNRVSGADTVTYEGQIARRNYASVSYSYGWDHGGFDPAEVTAAVTGLTLESYTATFFIDAGYAGAFNPNADSNSQELWTEGWTAFDALFYQDR